MEQSSLLTWGGKNNSCLLLPQLLTPNALEKKSSISMSRKRQKNLSLTKDVGPCVRTSYKSAYVSGLIMNQKQHGSQVTVLTPTISDIAALSVTVCF